MLVKLLAKDVNKDYEVVYSWFHNDFNNEYVRTDVIITYNNFKYVLVNKRKR